VSQQDIDFLRGVLERGVLLEDQDFPIAERIFRAFLVRRAVDGRTVVVLNGLPRHTGQACALEGSVAVEAVVCLECTAETVTQRLRNDPGGDRANRDDDQLPAVAKQTEHLPAAHRAAGRLVLSAGRAGCPCPGLGMDDGVCPLGGRSVAFHRRRTLIQVWGWQRPTLVVVAAADCIPVEVQRPIGTIQDRGRCDLLTLGSRRNHRAAPRSRLGGDRRATSPGGDHNQ
jgi:hypothetical protein